MKHMLDGEENENEEMNRRQLTIIDKMYFNIDISYSNMSSCSDRITRLVGLETACPSLAGVCTCS